uniref:asparagine synthase (glutamine-hydrolyzing) n=1 Tax=viral metagenome TaxID=1070528 RepID=A0A6C0IHH5_9ZZZZ
MCGIFALLNYEHLSKKTITNEFEKGKKRGPEFSKLEFSFMKMALGFHRLAINGLNIESNQPLIINDVVLLCNGEIYNFKQLYNYIGVTPTTGSDCEVIIHLFIKYGIEQTVTMLDGEFSFILYDNRISHNLNNQVYIVRDPLGVRPLYYFKNNIYNLNTLYGFASELKCLKDIYNFNSEQLTIGQFTPGTYSVFNMSNKSNAYWIPECENVSYFLPSFSHSWMINDTTSPVFIENMFPKIANYLNAAVNKRCLTTERPIACLLSGGLDSSLVTALVNYFYETHNLPKKLETYSIGLLGSEDLKYAKIVADYLGTNHTEIIVTEQEMFDAIPEVIMAIESYDTTTVRASIGNYLLGKYIASHSEAKVILNGDGSDELFGGYLYMNKCPDDIEFDKETRRLLKDIHLFDVLRSDKSISSHGLEPRTPFLDRSLVNFVLSIPPYFRNHTNLNKCEKFLLRNSFTINHFQDYNGRSLLPSEILWRKKEAFSDGVSSQGRSLYNILQEFIANDLNKDENTDKYKPCIETEKLYYKKIFDLFFENCSHILPYFWMPKYTNAIDPSARTLTFYSDCKTEA